MLPFNLIPHFILERLEDGERHGRFPATTLFVDISGFTAVTENLMPHGQAGLETLVNILDALFAPLIQAVYERGGFIITFAGDAFTAVFPAPVEMAQAVAAGWQVRQAMANGRQTTPYGTFSFTVKAGLAAGEVQWDIVTADDGQRALYFFQGIAIDRCAAAEHLAGPGDFVMTADVYQAVQSEVTAVPQADHFRITHFDLPPLPASPPPPPSLVAPSHLFFPPEVWQQTHRGEFRRVISLFISLPGVRTRTQLAAFLQIVFDRQAQYGGLLNHLDFGDKGCYLLLFWGAPGSYENDISRALDFVLDLQAQSSLPLQAGIAQRMAYAGFAGSSWRRTYTCYGRGVNLAARLMTNAPLGEIWLDERVAHYAGRFFDLESVGEKEFKGFKEKQAVYRLVERKEVAEIFYQGPFVGREGELAQLAQFLQPVLNGRSPGLLLIRGEAGIGKSRLVHALQTAEALNPPAVCWALCQTDQVLRRPLNPFRYWLQRYFDQSPAQSEARNKRNFTRQLDQLIEETADPPLKQELNRARSFLGALVDLFWLDSLYAELAPRLRQENTTLALIALIQAESLRHPLILHVEDAHWLDQESQHFLVDLGPHIADYPVAFMITARPDDPSTPLLPTAVIQQELHLSALPHQEIEVYVSQRAAHPLPPEWLTLLIKRAEGNPFFAEQILLYLEEQRITPSGEKLAAADLETILPRNVRDVLIARLDRLTQGVKEVVETASVLGREFETQLLSFMLQLERHQAMPPEMLRHQLTEAEQHAVWYALSEIRYIFRHTLMRDVAYELQLLARRQVLHQLAITALETVYAPDLAAHYHQLAYHAEHGRDADKQRLYYRLAGEAAQATYANETAVHYYTLLLPLLPEPEQSPIHRQLGHLAEMAGQWEQAKTHYQQAVSKVQGYQETDMALAQADLGDLLAEQGDYQFAHHWLQQALATFSRVQEARGISNTLYQLGEILWRQGHYQEAQSHFERSLEVSRAAGEQKQIASSLSGLGIVAEMQGDYPRSMALYEESLAVQRQIGHKYGISVMLNNLGIAAKNIGDYGRARALLAESLAIKQEIGNRAGVAITLNNLGEIALLQEDVVIAERYFQESLTLKQQTGNKRGMAITLSGLSHVASLRGDFAQAQRFLRQSMFLYQEVDDQRGILFDLAAFVSLGVKSNLPAQKLGRLGAAVVTLLLQLHTTLDPEDDSVFTESVRQIRQQLGEEMFQSVWAEGQNDSLKTALALAQEMEVAQ